MTFVLLVRCSTALCHAVAFTCNHLLVHFPLLGQKNSYLEQSKSILSNNNYSESSSRNTRA